MNTDCDIEMPPRPLYPCPNKDAALPKIPRDRTENVDPKFKTSRIEQQTPEVPPIVSLLRTETLEAT
jgi:hypothetical protein